MSTELEQVLQIIQGGKKASTSHLNSAWQKQMLGWVYSTALESAIMTYLTSNDMSKENLIRTLLTIIQNKPSDMSSSISEQVQAELEKVLNN